MKITTLVFDWGNTLMKVLPQYSGAMVNWPEVAAVEGAAEALQNLHGKYRLLVGTNAVDSDAPQISAALERVGLNQWIERVFTFHEIGCRKPESDFYIHLEKLAGASREHIAMIGDEYIADVLGAARAGWRAVWLNPANQYARGHWPLQTADILSMTELPAALNSLHLPSTSEALSWLQEQGTSNNLLIHVQMVAALAYHLALELRARGKAVNPVLAHRGGLLHDVAKLAAKDYRAGKVDHGLAAAEFLTRHGQPELAEIASRHLLFCISDSMRAPRSWEEKLVYFADKLVEGGGLAELETRLQALAQRYPADAERITQTMPFLTVMQQEISGCLEWQPEELLGRLKQALWQAN